MGAWDYMRSERCIAGLIAPRGLMYTGREYSASPATGYKKTHLAEQQVLVEEALTSPSRGEEGGDADAPPKSK